MDLRKIGVIIIFVGIVVTVVFINNQQIKYSNLNKQYRNEFEGEEYAKRRLQLNKDLEQEITEKLPYLESREIKKIVIAFSKEQDKM